MRIERFWGQPPGWFDTLDRETQAMLMADHMLHERDAQ